jgi:hypothetical protein
MRRFSREADRMGCEKQDCGAVVMNWIDGVGFLASAAVLATFCMKRMIVLRIIALISNILFAGYAYLDHLYPVLTLHLILIPINCFRLRELCGQSLLAAGIEHRVTLFARTVGVPTVIMRQKQ